MTNNKSIIYYLPFNLDWEKYIPKSYLDKIKKQNLWVAIAGTENNFTITQSDIDMKIEVIGDGCWEETIIFNKVLSDKEVKEIYNILEVGNE